ncbi:MAG: hypothetical protein H5U13_09255 [Parvibaculum sp.]|nr:hypothetical protein [Parvibaculum sp.]
MNWENWIPALSSTAALALGLYLLRRIFIKLVEKGIEHGFDKKLEGLRNELKASEERLKSELRLKEAEIADLRNNVLSDAVSRRRIFDQRRAQAIDDVWGNTIALGRARAIAQQLGMFDLAKIDKGVEENPKLAQFFEMLSAGLDLKDINIEAAQKSRPHLPPIVWALFSAYSTIVHIAVIQVKLLAIGTGANRFVKHDNIKTILKAALPEQSQQIDAFRPEDYHTLLENLESEILSKFRDLIRGSDLDQEALERARNILDAVRSVEPNLTEAQAEAST